MHENVNRRHAQHARASRYAVVALLVWVCMLPRMAAAGVPVQWKDYGYAYNAQGVPLVKVLSDFGRSSGVEIRVSLPWGEAVQGTVKAATAVEFLDRLAALHRFQWFVHNGVLYVSATADMTTERIEVARDAIADAKAALSGIGLFEPKFGWGEMPEEGAVTVSGPREYVRLVREVVAQRDRHDDYEAMVFPLKHASVDDRSVTIRNQTLVTPGAASLLKSMLGVRGDSAGRTLLGPSGSLHEPTAGPGLPPMPSLGSSGGDVAGTLGTNIAQRVNGTRAGSAGRSVSIEGDVRTNSIVIYDLAKRRAHYRKLIDSIDVPQQLVEIAAYIIDVNRERVQELGFGFEAGGRSGSVTVDPAGVLSGPALGGSTLVVASLDHFFSRLSLLEQEGQARVLARPSVLTLENLVAVLDLSQTVYLRATGERVALIEPVTAGMLLRVTPRIVKEKNSTQVHLTVDIEDGKISQTNASGDAPQVQRSTISTQAVLRDRQSLIIGGYNTDSSSTREGRVPGLSNLPLIGALFSGKSKVEQSRQRLFILSPRLVMPGQAGTL